MDWSTSRFETYGDADELDKTDKDVVEGTQ